MSLDHAFTGQPTEHGRNVITDEAGNSSSELFTDVGELMSMKQDTESELAILRRRQVEQRTGLSRSTLYQYIKDGKFPKPVPLGPRAVGWLEAEVRDWIATRIRIARDGTQ